MKTKMLEVVEILRYSFWFLPALISLCAAALAFVLAGAERSLLAPQPGGSFWLFVGTQEDARAVLSLVANSMVGIASVIFSITILTLTLATRRYGQQMLKEFMRDLVTQVALGTFVAIFVYCMLTILMMREGGRNEPRLTVSAGLFLALAGMGVLILFIQHMVTLMQSENIIATLSVNVRGIIDDLYPDRGAQEGGREAAAPREEGRVLEAPESGYLRAISVRELVRTAADAGVTVRAERQVGDFLIAGSPLATVWPRRGADRGTLRDIADCFTLSRNRMPRQDIRYAVGQIVEIAVTALSSSSTSPSTVHMCLDRFRELLCHLSRRPEPQGRYFDAQGELRVVLIPLTFPQVAGFVLEQLRRHGAGDTTVMIRLLKAVAKVVECTPRAGDREFLLAHAALIRDDAAQAAAQQADREHLEEAYRAVSAAGGKARGGKTT